MSHDLMHLRAALVRQPHAYPLLLDALRHAAGVLARGAVVKSAPLDREGTVWDAERRSFFGGFWWPCPYGNLFGGIHLLFEWRQPKAPPQEGPSLTWIPLTEASGYAAYVELRKGTRHDAKIVAMMSLERFAESLTVDGLRAMGEKIDKASVGVYDQSQLRGDKGESTPDKGA
jgi:hypothetical protein